MRLVSARWVIPAIPEGIIPEGAVALDDEGTVLAVGARGDLRRRFADAPEERAEGALLPGLVNAHCHLELSALAGAVPGGHGLVPWGGAGAPPAAPRAAGAQASGAPARAGEAGAP